MTTGKLNAKATSFVPSTAASQENFEDSFTEHMNVMKSIDDAMDASLTKGLHHDQSISMPGIPRNMVRHAAEFWFPESRDCSCCKGFKHGCGCAVSHNGVCLDCVSQDSTGSK